jgi:hypothetical protein
VQPQQALFGGLRTAERARRAARARPWPKFSADAAHAAAARVSILLGLFARRFSSSRME